MTTPAETEKFTLDDLLALWESAPQAYKPALFVYFPQVLPTGGVVKGSAGETAGPITGLAAPLDLDWIYRELVLRLGNMPGDLVVRINPAPGSTEKSRTVAVPIGEGHVLRWGAAPRTEQRAAPAPAVLPPAPTPPPPTDLVTALTTMMMTMMSTLMKSATEKGPDPMVQMLMNENRGLQERLAAAVQLPMKLEKSQWQEALEFGEKMAGNNNGAFAALAGPLDKLASGVEKGFSTKGEIEKTKADTELLRVQMQLLEKQLQAAKAGLIEMSAEDKETGEAALKEAAEAVAAAKNGLA